MRENTTVVTESAPQNLPSDAMQAPVLDKKTLNKVWFSWIAWGQICYNYERMMGLGFTHAVSYVLQKLYPGRKDKVAEGLSRHMTFYNTENTWGSIILGIVTSLEEGIAHGEPVDEEGISGLKTALMGPMAGIGDSITQALVKVVFLGIAVDFALKGNPIGVILFVLGMCLYSTLVSRSMFFTGYRIGRQSVIQLLQGSKVKYITEALGAVGMMVLGALVANNMNITTPLSLKSGQLAIEIQPMLDGILPKLLNVCAFFGVYALLKKEVSTNKIILIIFFVAAVLSLTGIL